MANPPPITPKFNEAAKPPPEKKADKPAPALKPPAPRAPAPGGPSQAKIDAMKSQSQFVPTLPGKPPAPQKSPVLTKEDVRSGQKGVLKQEFDKRKGK